MAAAPKPPNQAEVRAALEEYRRAEAAGDLDPGVIRALSRGYRAPRLWLAAIEKLEPRPPGAPAGYRAPPPIDRATLLRVVEHPFAPVDARVAATVLLAPDLDATELEHIEAVATVATDKKLSEALRQASATGRDAEHRLLALELAEKLDTHR